jgi:chromate transporter
MFKGDENREAVGASRDIMQHSVEHASFNGIFWTFFRIGLFTLGGGLVMVSVMRHELVLKRQWVREEDFISEISTATVVPGVIAVNMAYMQGRRMRGWLGSLVAVAGTVLPSVGVILLVAWIAFPFFSHPKVAAFLKGCSIAVVGQLAFTGYIFARKHLKSLANILICVIAIAVIALLKWHPIWAVVIAGTIGYFVCDKTKLTENERDDDTL